MPMNPPAAVMNESARGVRLFHPGNFVRDDRLGWGRMIPGHRARGAATGKAMQGGELFAVPLSTHARHLVV